MKEGNIILATKQFTSGVSIDRINLNKRFAFYQFLRSFVNLKDTEQLELMITFDMHF